MGAKSSTTETSADQTGLQRFSEIYGRYSKAMARVVARIVRPYEVEDVVQEAYLRIFQAAKQQQIRHPRAFLLTTVRNIALNLTARADALNHAAAPLCGADTDSGDQHDRISQFAPDGMADSAERRAQLDEEFLIFCRAIRELPPVCRKAFVLKKVYGLSQREVAGELCVSEGTVEKHLTRGLQVCLAYMSAHGYPQYVAKCSVTELRGRKSA